MTQPLTTEQINELRNEYILDSLSSQMEQLDGLADRVKHGLAAWMHYPHSLEHDTLQLEHLLTHISTLSQLVRPLFQYSLGNCDTKAEIDLASKALELLESRPAVPNGAKLDKLLKTYSAELKVEKRHREYVNAQRIVLADIEASNREIL